MKKLRIILQSNYFYLFLMLFVAILLYFNACDKSKYDINDDVIIGTITSYYIDNDKLVITIFGKEKVKNKMKEIEMKNQKKEATKAELDMYDDLEIVLEMYERGFEFLPVDLYESEATKFKVQENKLRPPLNSIPGFGGVAAQGIVEARKDGKFMSIDDLKIRAKIGASGADLLKEFGCLEGMSQSNQLSLFG